MPDIVDRRAQPGPAQIPQHEHIRHQEQQRKQPPTRASLRITRNRCRQQHRPFRPQHKVRETRHDRRGDLHRSHLTLHLAWFPMDTA